MNFFPPDPPEDETENADQPPTPWRKPSDDEVPAIYPTGETIALTDTVALVLSFARVYSNGVEFVIDRRIRRGGASRADWRQMQARIHNHFGPDPERLRFGVVLGDGQQLIADHPGMLGESPEASSLTYSGGGGGGSDDIWRFEDDLWLWPLPPEGPLEFVVQWPAFGVPESRVVLDSAPLRECASSARPVWGAR
ncbi:hypothetical protein [Leifsonia sp. AG29]|uniref:hypothetical protein n=1 Tax=Leifsonia sp. AG29 TaxID=2598860 RepID=UPI00131C4E2D|nr:hypothetical protein [Leifsonia sp. AG29]